MFSRAAACSEKGCRGGQNEDTHIYEKVIFNLNGEEILGEIFGVFDGHCGKGTANYLEKNSVNVFKTNFEKCVTNINNKEEIDEAFRQTQLEWMMNLPHDRSGSTVIFTLFLCDTQTVHNLYTGDGRINYFNKHTGETYETDIDFIDFADNETKKYNGKALNDVHQINTKLCKYDKTCPRRILGLMGNHEITCDKENFDYDDYYFEGDEKFHDFNEWVKFNKYFKGYDGVIVPRFNGNCMRMVNLQPTRSMGFEEFAIPLGCMISFKVNPDIKVVFSCDGLDDNNAVNHNNLGELLLNPSLANQEFFENHIGIKNKKNVGTIPPASSSLTEKVEWLRDRFNFGNHLARWDNDWRSGLDKSIPYIRECNLENISSIENQAEFLTNLAIVRLSGDNVTLIIAEFDGN